MFNKNFKMTREAQHTSAVFSDHSSDNKIQSKCLACMFKKILCLMCLVFVSDITAGGAESCWVESLARKVEFQYAGHLFLAS